MEAIYVTVAFTVQSLTVGIKRHLSFFISSTKYFRTMSVAIRQLLAVAQDVRHRVEANEVQCLMVPPRVLSWLEEVEMIKDMVERIPPGGNGCFNIKMRYKTGKTSIYILKHVENLMRQQSEFIWIDVPVPIVKIRNSRIFLFNDALELLDPKNNKTRMIALTGMGGIGKTEMMEKLKEAVEQRKMFDWVVKVVLGANCNLIDIQQTVAEYIGQPLNETEKDAWAYLLQKRFKEMSTDGNKNILVILDDVWDEVELENIGLPSPLSKGFKLLLTSRNEQVCSQMGVETSSILRLAVLEEQEANNLFWKIVGPVSDTHLHQVGEDIVKKCGGLPMAIKTISYSLRNKPKEVWEVAFSHLQTNEMYDVTIHKVFEMSYNNLKEGDKATFLLCGLFPKAYDICIEDLVRYGWGLKLFENESTTIATTRHRVNACVNSLLQSNLLDKSAHEGYIKMHDLVHNFVLINLSEVKQASVVINSDNVSKLELLPERSYERILIKCIGRVHEIPAYIDFPNLVFLKLMGGENLLKFPEDFFERMENLEVVAYENMYQPLVTQYPYSLCTLCFHSCLLAYDISLLGDLIHLEVLSFANCGIRNLPSAIGKLRKLKLLDLNGCVELRIDDGVLGNLVKLEELYMRTFEGKYIRFTDANRDELRMLSSNLSALELEFFENKAQPKDVFFVKLERFKISLGCPLGDQDKGSYKNTLKLVTSRSVLVECKISELFVKTEELHLSVDDLNQLEGILLQPSHDSFRNLKILSVSHCTDLTYLFTTPMANGMMKLESLTVSSCPSRINCIYCGF